VSGVFNILVRAVDEYGGMSTQINYKLTVNTFCGDGIVEKPNMEKTSGLAHLGQEECDDGNNVDTDSCNNNCEWTCGAANNVNFSNGTSFAMNLDDDDDPSHTENNLGNYLKIAKSIPTDYVWIANSNLNRISKMRTADFTRENIYNVGTDPSRVAVNIETGEVWIANRKSNDVTKINSAGIVTTCPLPAGALGPRGVAIDSDGNAWIGYYTVLDVPTGSGQGGKIIKMAAGLPCNSLSQPIDLGGYPYGFAIDSQNNIWISNRDSVNGNKIQRFNTSLNPPRVDFEQPAFSVYGITVDLSDNVWVAAYAIDATGVSAGIYKINTHNNNEFVQYTFAPGLQHSRGVTLDLAGNIWVALDSSNMVVRIPANQVDADIAVLTPSYYSANLTTPIGITGDSRGRVWVIGFDNQVSIFEMNGTRDITLAPGQAGDVGAAPYTYSDMAGLNRAMLLRSARWINNSIDGLYNDQHWGRISWNQNPPNNANNEIEVFVCANNVNSNPAPDSTCWQTAAVWNNLNLENRVGRYLHFKIEISARDRMTHPVLWNMRANCN
jgi:streptogramin lyase